MLNYITTKSEEVLHVIQERQDLRASWQLEIAREQQEKLKKRTEEGAQLPSAEELRQERRLLFMEKKELRNDWGQREREKNERRKLNPLKAKVDFTAPKITPLGNSALSLDADRYETGPMKILRKAREKKAKAIEEARNAGVKIEEGDVEKNSEAGAV